MAQLSEKTIKVWEVASGKERLSLEGHKDAVLSVAFNADGKVLASGSSDKTIKVWNIATGKNTATLEGHRGPVRFLAYSFDGRTLASGSWDYVRGHVKLWDTVPAK